MKYTIRTTLAGLLCLGASQLLSFALVTDYVEAFSNGTIMAAGSRTGSNGTAAFNIEGSGNAANFTSFGVMDFSIAALTIPSGEMLSSVNSLSIKLTQFNAAFSVGGGLNFYLTSDNSANIAPGSTALKYQPTDPPGGIGSQFSSLYQLSSGFYNVISSGTVDTFTFSLDGLDPAGLNYLAGLMTTGGTLRLVVAASEAQTAATYAGFASSTYTGPQISVDYSTTPIPEPSVVALMVLGVSVFAMRYVRMRRAPAV